MHIYAHENKQTILHKQQANIGFKFKTVTLLTLLLAACEKVPTEELPIDGKPTKVDDKKPGPDDEIIVGTKGDNIFIANKGADKIDGGKGIDTVDYTEAKVRVFVSLDGKLGKGGIAEGDVLIGIKNLIGSKFDDHLVGNVGVNVIKGMGGDDIVEGAAGADKLSGGSGTDTLSYAHSDKAVKVNLALNTSSGGHATGDVYDSFENIIGSAFNDILLGNSAANEIFGGKGNDTLIGGEGADRLDGGAGVDLVDYGLSNA